MARTVTFAKDQAGVTLPGPLPGALMREVKHQATGLTAGGTRYAYEDSAEDATDIDMDHDDWHTTRADGSPNFKWNNVRYDTMADWCTAVGLECHGTEAEPGLIDPAALQFAPATGSANIDTALPIPGINDVFSGAGPDRGYIEAGSVEPSW